MRSEKMLIVSAIFAIAIMLPSVACAQWGGYGIFGYGGGFGGGTLEGNYLQGMSQVIRAQGEYNLNTAQAGISYEDARSKYLDNNRKWRQDLFQMREEQQRLAIEQREASRALNAERNAARAAAPPVSRGLGPNALDPLTGRISWPELLLKKEFDEQRKQIDQSFELRAMTSHGGTSEKIHSSVQQMLTVLRSQIQKLPANEYVAAHKFLNALDYTARAESM